MISIILLAHNIRSTHNIGSIFRTSEGFGVSEIWLSGYSPYPDIALSPLSCQPDTRLPHIRHKITEQIHKTALGAERLVPFRYDEKLQIDAVTARGYQLAALEQSATSRDITTFRATHNIALLLGEEVHGIPDNILKQCDLTLEIPMRGQKESFNVSVAAGIALYQLRVT